MVQDGKLYVIDLAPLSADDTAVLGAQVQQHALGGQTAAYLYQTTAGNPLFVVETIRAGGKSEQLTTEVGMLARAHALPNADVQLPPKIHAVIEARLVQLSPTARMLAQVAATIGRSFTLSLLMAASGENEEVAVHGLDELWQRRIIRAQGDARYDFTHDRIRDVAYVAGSPVKRANFHRRVAMALETLHAGDLDPLAGELGMHCQYAGAWAEALAYYRRAASVARHLFAHGEEVDYLQKALFAVHMLPAEGAAATAEIELWLDLGGAQSRVHDWNHALVAAAWQNADDLAAERGLLRYRCQALELLAYVLGIRGQWHQARAFDELALSFAQEIGDEELIGRKAAKSGVTIFHSGDFVQALALFNRQLTIADSPKALARAWLEHKISSSMYVNLAESLWLVGFPDQALAYGSALLAVGHQQANFSMRCAGPGLIGMFYSFLRDASTVRVVGEGLAAFCSDNDCPWHAMTGHLLRGWAMAQQGNVQEGLPLVRMGVDEERRRNIRDLEPHYRSLLAETLALAGEWEEALDEVIAVMAYAEECGNCFWNAHLLKLKGDLLQALSYSTGEVEACYQQAIDTARQQGAKTLELRATTGLARLWQGQGRQVEARKALAEVYGWFTEGFGTVDLLEAKALLDEL
jgi:tetratricopeptide (TPR) repeat protein